MGINKVEINRNGTTETLIDLTSDTITADDVLSGKKFHDASGELKTGKVDDYRGSDLFTYSTSIDNATVAYQTRGIRLIGSSDWLNRTMIDSDTTFNIDILPSNFESYFGNATAEDVTEGKTFTSMSGLKIIGTAQSSSGFEYATELYSNDAESITYTSTGAGTALTKIIANIYKYPFVAVIIENTAPKENLQFVRSMTIIGNSTYANNTVNYLRYGTQQYYNSSGTLANMSSTSYGLWGYSITTSSLTIRGRCNNSYYTSLTGTYKVRVLGIKF